MGKDMRTGNCVLSLWKATPDVTTPLQVGTNSGVGGGGRYREGEVGVSGLNEAGKNLCWQVMNALPSQFHLVPQQQSGEEGMQRTVTISRHSHATKPVGLR
jgi:hypothetical protein